VREVVQADLVPLRAEISISYDEGAVVPVTMHDGTVVRLRKVAADYDPTDRDAVYAYVRERQRMGEVATGLLYVSEDMPEMMEQDDVVATPLVDLPYGDLVPGAAALQELMRQYR
jgi:2-oxoglutarate ferredoxin oxidoreductase subunit beta